MRHHAKIPVAIVLIMMAAIPFAWAQPGGGTTAARVPEFDSGAPSTSIPETPAVGPQGPAGQMGPSGPAGHDGRNGQNGTTRRIYERVNVGGGRTVIVYRDVPAKDKYEKSSATARNEQWDSISTAQYTANDAKTQVEALGGRVTNLEIKAAPAGKSREKEKSMTTFFACLGGALILLLVCVLAVLALRERRNGNNDNNTAAQATALAGVLAHVCVPEEPSDEERTASYATALGQIAHDVDSQQVVDLSVGPFGARLRRAPSATNPVAVRAGDVESLGVEAVELALRGLSTTESDDKPEAIPAPSLHITFNPVITIGGKDGRDGINGQPGKPGDPGRDAIAAIPAKPATPAVERTPVRETPAKPATPAPTRKPMPEVSPTERARRAREHEAGQEAARVAEAEERASREPAAPAPEWEPSREDWEAAYEELRTAARRLKVTLERDSISRMCGWLAWSLHPDRQQMTGEQAVQRALDEGLAEPWKPRTITSGEGPEGTTMAQALTDAGLKPEPETPPPPAEKPAPAKPAVKATAAAKVRGPKKDDKKNK